MIFVVSKYILPFGVGLTLYKLIFIREDADYNIVLKHEECHVKQWTEIGFFKFMYLYLSELKRVGYWNNKYEIEARIAENK